MKNIELLAEAQHKIWIGWVRNLVERYLQEDGTIVIPADKVESWKNLANTEYEELSKAEQEKDREQVYEHLAPVPIIRDALEVDGEDDTKVYNLYSVQANGKDVLSVDFDGVCSIYRQWVSPSDIPDRPVPYLFDALYSYHRHFHICIFSSRSHQRGGRKGMMQWFIDNHEKWFRTLSEADQESMRVRGKENANEIVPDKFIEYLFFPTEKPRAFVTLDDRAITFDGSFPPVEDLLGFVPWNRRHGKNYL